MATLITSPASKLEKETSQNSPSDTVTKNDSPTNSLPFDVIRAGLGVANTRPINVNSPTNTSPSPEMLDSSADKDLRFGATCVLTGVVALTGCAGSVIAGVAVGGSAVPVVAAVSALALPLVAIGVGATVAGEAKKMFPDLQPAVDKLADRLINGKDTFAPESNVATSTTEPPKFASKVSEQSAKPLSSQGKVEDGSDLSLPRASTQRNSPVAQANEREID